MKQIILVIVAALGMAAFSGHADARSYSYHLYRGHSSSHYYTNVSGHGVHRPVFSAGRPAGATAKCADGSYSFSEHARGTCSHHGGVR